MLWVLSSINLLAGGAAIAALAWFFYVRYRGEAFHWQSEIIRGLAATSLITFAGSFILYIQNDFSVLGIYQTSSHIQIEQTNKLLSLFASFFISVPGSLLTLQLVFSAFIITYLKKLSQTQIAVAFFYYALFSVLLAFAPTSMLDYHINPAPREGLSLAVSLLSPLPLLHWVFVLATLVLLAFHSLTAFDKGEAKQLHIIMLATALLSLIFLVLYRDASGDKLWSFSHHDTALAALALLAWLLPRSEIARRFSPVAFLLLTGVLLLNPLGHLTISPAVFERIHWIAAAGFTALLFWLFFSGKISGEKISIVEIVALVSTALLLAFAVYQSSVRSDGVHPDAPSASLALFSALSALVALGGIFFQSYGSSTGSLVRSGTLLLVLLALGIGQSLIFGLPLSISLLFSAVGGSFFVLSAIRIFTDKAEVSFAFLSLLTLALFILAAPGKNSSVELAKLEAETSDSILYALENKEEKFFPDEQRPVRYTETWKIGAYTKSKKTWNIQVPVGLYPRFSGLSQNYTEVSVNTPSVKVYTFPLFYALTAAKDYTGEGRVSLEISKKAWWNSIPVLFSLYISFILVWATRFFLTRRKQQVNV